METKTINSNSVNNQSKTTEQLGLHSQIHISSPLHTCINSDEEIDQDRFIHCKLCSNRFKTLCTFHDHLTKCEGSGSYIFHYQTFQAYPLSEFCANFDNREFLQTESRDRITDEIELNQIKLALKNYVDELNDLFYQVRNNTRKSINNVCDAATQTSSTDSDKTPALNIANQTSNLLESDKVTRKRIKGNGMTEKPQTTNSRKMTTRARGLNKADKSKGKGGRKRKAIKIPNDNSKQCRTYNEVIDSPDLILIKTEIQRENPTEDCNDETLSNEISGTQDNEIDMLNTCPTNSLIKTEHEFESGISIRKLKPNEEEGQLKSLKEISSRKLKDNNPVSKSKPDKKSNKTTRKVRKKTTEKQKDQSKWPEPIPCDICGKSFMTYRMEDHKVCHSDVRAHACDVCPKTFKHKRHLVAHKRLHEDIFPHKCDICGQGYISRGQLQRHLFFHKDNSERPFKCEVCGYGFITDSHLKRHMIVHTGEKKVQCELCGMKFIQNHNLKSHISRVHHRERKYQCAECGEKFLTNYQRKCHVLKHKGLKPYKCILCAADYIERKALRKHMKNVHHVDFDELNIAESKNDKSYEAYLFRKGLQSHLDTSYDLSQTPHEKETGSKLLTPTEDYAESQSIDSLSQVLVSDENQSTESKSHENDTDKVSV